MFIPCIITLDEARVHIGASTQMQQGGSLGHLWGPESGCLLKVCALGALLAFPFSQPWGSHMWKHEGKDIAQKEDSAGELKRVHFL